MSAFFLAINRNGDDFSSQTAHSMLAAIADYGGDSAHLEVQQNFAIGYQQFCTVSEEQGERQPLFDQSSGSYFAFYGRLDNRTQVIELLDCRGQEKASDAHLVHQYLIRFDGQDLDRIIGPFSFVWYHPSSARVLAARDPMGGRNLVFKADKQHLLVASHEMALVAHPCVDYQFNLSRIARMVAQIMPDTDESMIQGLGVIAPGQCLRVNGGSHTVERFYLFDPATRIRFDTEQDYAQEFKRLLNQAVARRARSVGPIATMLSGGMDSVPISILLAQQLAQEGQTLSAFSWVYDEYPEADERHYSQPICEKYSIQQFCINCDAVRPTLDQTLYLDPLIPFAIPYVAVQQALLKEVQANGIRTLITGIHGDLLYGHADSLLLELLAAGKWRKCWLEFKRLWSYRENRRYMLKHMLLEQLPGVRRLINLRRNIRPLHDPMLTAGINQQLSHQTPDLFEPSLKALRPKSYRAVLGGFAGEDQALGRLMEANYSLERRYPFRDRELCEFMLAIPSEHLTFGGMPRPIVKRAFEHEFSQDLMQRKDKTSFTAAIVGAIEADHSWRDWFAKPNAAWQDFVKKRYFDDNPANKPEIQVVQWRCGYYDYWKSVCYNRVANEMGLSNEQKNQK